MIGTSEIPADLQPNRKPVQLILFEHSPKVLSIAEFTSYDVPHKLEQLAKAIRKDEYDGVLEAIIMFRTRNDKTGYHTYRAFQYGYGNRATAIAAAQFLITTLTFEDEDD